MYPTLLADYKDLGAHEEIVSGKQELLTTSLSVICSEFQSITFVECDMSDEGFKVGHYSSFVARTEYSLEKDNIIKHHVLHEELEPRNYWSVVGNIEDSLNMSGTIGYDKYDEQFLIGLW